MITVLVVDDVEVIRLSIQQILKRKYPQMELLGAENGVDAIQVVEQNEVDIVVTDIQMPLCSGLELTRHLREKMDFKKPVIIITGFGEFSYAQQALRLQTVDYILKPLNNEKLYTAMEEAMKQLDNMDNVRYALRAQAQRETHEKKSQWREALQYALLLSAPLPEYIKQERLVFGLAVFAIKQESIVTAGFSVNEYSLVTYGVQNAIDEISQKEQYILLQNPSESGELLMLFFHNEEKHLLSAMERALERVHQQIEHQLGIQLLMGVSKPSPCVDETMYEQAHNALTGYLSDTKGTLFWYHVPQNSKLEDKIVTAIRQFIKKRQFIELEQYLLELFEHTEAGGLFSQIEQATLLIASGLVRESKNGLERLGGRLPLTGDKLTGFESIHAMVRHIIDIAEDTLLILEDDSKDDSTIDRVKEYIDQHYMDSISVRELANDFHISYSYLSAQFTKEVGQSITSYLLMRRLEVAKSLLVKTEADINTIAASVGYSDLQYFYRVFKKYQGMTPMKYRNS